ncbi:hypothetical protein Ancab_028439 [Ancistrocladus abbreviatus]
MITTRDKKVADHICPDSALALWNLSFEEGWELFSRKVFRGRACSPCLKLFVEKIVGKCRGLHLSIIVMAEDFEVPTRQLIQLWVAKGLIQKSRERSVEDIAEDDLENLIDRNLVQAEKFGVDAGVKSCRIHDMLRELCITEAAKENFL